MALLSLPVMKLSARSIGLGEHLAIALSAFLAGWLLMAVLSAACLLAPVDLNAPARSETSGLVVLGGLPFIGWLISDDLSQRGVTRTFPIGLRVILWIMAVGFIEIMALFGHTFDGRGAL